MRKTILTALILGVLSIPVLAQSWTDISSQITLSGPQDWPGGCSGVVVNRITGEVMINIIGFGVWKSADKGGTWTRIDNNTASGRCETGWGLQVDQDNPQRMAQFSLDGHAAYTPDGVTWKRMTDRNRNWDFGSVDWSSPDPKVMLVSAHESGGLIFKTTNGGTSWTQLPVQFPQRPTGTQSTMMGVIDAATFIYAKGDGIYRSTDTGATWTQVSTANPLSMVVVQFKGVFYLGTATGLIVSHDKGASWQTQGASLNIYQGPWFGADESTMVVIGKAGIGKTTDAGAHWTLLSPLCPIVGIDPVYHAEFSFDPTYFGGYTWDPNNNVLYTSCMANPAYKKEMGGSEIENLSVSAKNTGLALSALPNPFRPSCRISVSLPDAGRISLDVVDVTGRTVKKLFAGNLGAGRHSMVWDATDKFNRKVSAGVYIYKLSAGSKTMIQKAMLAE